MVGELTTEARPSNVTERDKPRVYVIVGAPNRGKMDLALDIVNLVPELTFVDIPNPPEYALGELADYRAETYHALHRYFISGEHYKAGKPVIQIHSLIDSMAWATHNAHRKLLNGTAAMDGPEAFTAAFVGMVTLNSFNADHIFIIEGNEPDDLELYQYMVWIVELFNISHTFLYEGDESQWPEICAKIIKGE